MTHHTRTEKLFISLICLLLSQSSFGQNDKLYEKGIKAFYKEKFEEAAIYFEQIESSGRTFKDTRYRREISYLVQREHRERSIDRILTYSESKSKSDKFHYYWMGRIYANRYMFPEAVDAWKKFIARKVQKSDEILSETQDFIDHAEEMVQFFDNPDNYEIHQLGAPVNTRFSELSPSFSNNNNRLMFTSNRSSNSSETFEVFQSISEDAGWGEPSAVVALGNFPREKANIEIVNEDGKLFMFRDDKKGDLYYSQFDGESWDAPKEFDSEITTTHISSHFFINEHEDRVVFSALNKKMGLDLFESFKNPQTGKWEKPHPFAPTVNSNYDEDSPFLSADESTFYFSSDKPGGVGGLDIYECHYNAQNNTWSEPQNMGWPINSPDDELFFRVDKDGKSGYFTSNRIRSLGEHDIFYFWGIQQTKVEGKVLFAHDGSAVSNGEIRFHPTQYLDEYFRSDIDENGKYSTNIISNEVFKVEIIDGFDTLLVQPFATVDAEGEVITHHKDFHVISPDLSPTEKKTLEKKYAQERTLSPTSPHAAKEPEMIEAVEKTLLNEMVNDPRDMSVEKKPKVSDQRGVRLANVYFEYNTSRLKKESDTKLRELYDYLVAKPEVKIEISGHTDNLGNKQFNQSISQKRADSVKSWLIDAGIAPTRITAIGYGQTRPIASNDDEQNGRALNRRIEVKVIQ